MYSHNQFSMGKKIFIKREHARNDGKMKLSSLSDGDRTPAQKTADAKRPGRPRKNDDD
jgi:hypothetical protein